MRAGFGRCQDAAIPGAGQSSRSVAMPGTLFRPRTVFLALAAVVAMLPVRTLMPPNRGWRRTTRISRRPRSRAFPPAPTWRCSSAPPGRRSSKASARSRAARSAVPRDRAPPRSAPAWGARRRPTCGTSSSATDAWSKGGQIDSTTGIAAQKIYLFNGYNDAVVARGVTNALQGSIDTISGRTRATCSTRRRSAPAIRR